ncbi:MAG: ECF transporter S component [Clostridia bacterium]|nr:ECF transporter S component [Clostridia bacterium]
MSENKRYNIRKVILLALMVALAYVIEYVVHVKVLFLTFDIKDSVIVLASMIIGPWASPVISLVLSFIEFITISDTGIWGLIMNFIGSVSFSLTVSLIYKFKKNFFGAVVSLISGVFMGTAVMLIMNMIITPIYTGSSAGDVLKMIPSLLLPFNLAKYMLNASVVAFLYKPVITALRKIGFIENGSSSMKFGKNTVIMLIFALLAALISVSILLFFLKADFSFFK